MKLLKIALVCAVAALTLPAQAATVTLDLRRDSVADFGDRYVNSGDSVSAGGFVLTFRNVVIDSTSTGSVSRSGMHFSSYYSNTIITLDLVFNIDTVIETYSMGYVENTGNETFQISGVNGTSGANSFGSRGTSQFDMGTIPVFLAGETYSLTHTVSGFRQFALLSGLELSSPPPAVIPLPASLPLLLAGFGAVAFLRRRKRVAKHNSQC
ncbi:VPLPA-CTERM sorting domain-containing protein [Roseobacter sinensis]|uniref:VPLPA-CTERM sorting domain-containing protein n=1 Tax=Roseobacter sinensis TaxID=2931391 RepID=A0ABT3BEW4_9RHOB|nr:VPLPA-CTERM sorting domain-containing protein [Roseobacter sp. WL0113]MCV3272090.1 VPLPA-CTERM sorting domain-containing protein [Roseobacter sp. WL0113]